jgi:predicted RNA-binding protein with PIN domain
MPLLIDGHNLIPKVPGISLEEADDEIQLIELLQAYCQRKHRQAEVYFDQGSPGGVKARNFGLVIARFVPQGSTADQAIISRLQRLGKGVRNWTVVSSDLAVQAAARAAHARVLSSEAFAARIMQTLGDSAADPGNRAETKLSADEIDDWLGLFGGREENEG